jgi:hypothetical protein
VPANWKVILSLALLLAVFLLGFVPQFRESRRLSSELQDTRTSLAVAQEQRTIDDIRGLAGRTLLEVSRQNYGLATEHSSTLFNKLRELAGTTQNETLKTAAADLLSSRDSITSALAQGNPLVISDLQRLLEAAYNLPDAAPVSR